MQQNTQSRDQLKHNLTAEVLRTAGTVRLTAFGYSMLPALWPGDFLTIQAQSFDQVQVRDVVLFAREGRFFIHRVLEKREKDSERHLVTRGDALPEADAPVRPEEVLGAIVSVRHGDRDVPVPDCRGARRGLGLALTYSVRLRSLALRWRAWRSPGGSLKSEWAPEEAPLR
ncbi:MAG: hypothetical protein WA628_10425 [Terriglobales bacterium]